MSRSSIPPVTAAMAVLALCSCAAPSDTVDAGRDVLLIVVDTLRADHVGVYGRAPHPATPEIDRFARQGRWLDPVWASSPWTPPSIMSIMTSLEPAVHGLALDGRRMADAAPAVPPGTATLAEVLRGAGYQTLAVTAGGGVGRGYGFDRGFDRFFEPTPTPPEDVEAGVDLALAWLEEADDRPLLLFFHTYEVHQPNTHAGFEGGGDPAAAAVAAYASDLAFADRHVGRLLEGFDALRGLAGSVVVITSDHGENLHDRELGVRPVDHGHHLHRELLEVPLIVVAPGLVPPDGATAGPAMLLDVMPTVLSLVGVEPKDLPLQGRDLRPLLQGRSTTDRDRDLAAGAPLQGPTWDALRTRDWTLLRAPRVAGDDWWAGVQLPRLALYDRRRDSDERRDVAAEHPEVVVELGRRLDARRRENLELRETLGGSSEPAGFGAREALESLGYLDPAATAAASPSP